MADGIAINSEKGAVRKSVEWGDKAERRAHHHWLFHATYKWGMAEGALCLPCQLREGGQHG